MTGEIVFLAHRVPYPPNRGDKIRSWNILKALAKLAPVHVVALCDDPADMQHIDVIDGVAASVAIVPPDGGKAIAMARALITGGSASVAACASGAAQAVVTRLLSERPISAIFAFSGQMAQFVPNDLNGPRFVMDFVDMDSAKFLAFARDGGGISGFANAQEARRLFAHELKTAQRADLSLFVSDAEAALFREKSGLGADRVRTLENGVDLDFFAPATTRAAVQVQGLPLIVFTGQMDYRPNIDAVVAFAEATMPLVRAKLPDARFAIVGRAPTDRVLALAGLPGVTVTGAVDDVRDWLHAADMVVAPLKLARGIQNKVLEAMAMAKPVIASPAAAEGIDAEAGRDLIIADTADAESDAILRLATDPAVAARLGMAARARIVERYGWDAQMAGLRDILGLSPVRDQAA